MLLTTWHCKPSVLNKKHFGEVGLPLPTSRLLPVQQSHNWFQTSSESPRQALSKKLCDASSPPNSLTCSTRSHLPPHFRPLHQVQGINAENLGQVQAVVTAGHNQYRAVHVNNVGHVLADLHPS